MPGERYLFLCFTNRCGSTYFAQLLYSTGQLAYAGEPTTDGPGAFEQHIASRPVSHGWIGSKLGLAQLQTLARSGFLAAIRAQSHFILLERQDKLAQAISRVIAFARGGWTSQQVPANRQTLTYDRREIDAHLEVTRQETYGFYSFFAANQITPLHLSYESVLRDPHGTVTQTGAHLGLPDLLARPEIIELRRQSSEVNRAWKARYLEGN